MALCVQCCDVITIRLMCVFVCRGGGGGGGEGARGEAWGDIKRNSPYGADVARVNSLMH